MARRRSRMVHLLEQRIRNKEIMARRKSEPNDQCVKVKSFRNRAMIQGMILFRVRASRMVPTLIGRRRPGMTVPSAAKRREWVAQTFKVTGSAICQARRGLASHQCGPTMTVQTSWYQRLKELAHKPRLRSLLQRAKPPPPRKRNNTRTVWHCSKPSRKSSQRPRRARRRQSNAITSSRST